MLRTCSNARCAAVCLRRADNRIQHVGSARCAQQRLARGGAARRSGVHQRRPAVVIGRLQHRLHSLVAARVARRLQQRLHRLEAPLHRRKVQRRAPRVVLARRASSERSQHTICSRSCYVVQRGAQLRGIAVVRRHVQCRARVRRCRNGHRIILAQ
jgi:hypothetical protein